LADFRDRIATLSRLAFSASAALAVRDYWLSVDPNSSTDEVLAWCANPEFNRDRNFRRDTAPGSLFPAVSVQAARVHTGARWRSFLSIEPLRRVHLLTFRAIGAALSSDWMALFSDRYEVDDAF
jgi:hypothetical protein